MSLFQKIQKIKPKLKDSSVATYINSLYKICRQIEGKDKKCKHLGDLSFLNDYQKVLSLIKDEPITTQKNRLTAIVVSLKALEKEPKLIDRYSKEMERLSEKYSKQIDKQVKTEKQKKNWLGLDEIKDLVNLLFGRIKEQKLHKKKELSNKEYSELQNYIIMRFYLEYPLRNDIADVKVIKSKRHDDNKNNFLLVRSGSIYLILNHYKTVSKYGKKSYKLDEKLSKLIRLLLRHNDSGYFLVKYDRKRALNRNGLTKLLNRLFIKETGKRLSTSMLRHIQISEARKNDPTIKQIQDKNKQIENKFLHSSSMNQQYRKQ